MVGPRPSEEGGGSYLPTSWTECAPSWPDWAPSALGSRLAWLPPRPIDSLVIVVRDPRRAGPVVEQLGPEVQVRKGAVDELPPADVTLVTASSGAQAGGRGGVDRR